MDKLIPQVSKSSICPDCKNISKLDKTEYTFSKFNYKYDNVHGVYYCYNCNLVFTSDFIPIYKLTNPVSNGSNNGILRFIENRSTDHSELLSQIKLNFSRLTDDERLEIMSDYCKFCGTDTTKEKCNCWKDE